MISGKQYKNEDLKFFVWLNYALQILTFFTSGLAFIASGIVAYVKYDDSIGMLEESHFRWQIRTFWIGLGATVAGAILLVIYIGVIVLALAQLWILYRAIKGGYYYSEDREMNNNGIF